MSAAHLNAGRNAEKIAQRWLAKHGLKLVDANFRCRYGELDLIMREGSCLVVIEVRYRNSGRYGGAAGSITGAKMMRIGLATQAFLNRHPEYRSLALRFDVLALSGTGRTRRIDWRRQAFNFDEGLPGCD